MTPAELRDARGTLGAMWGLHRPLGLSELARALQLSGESGDDTIRKWESGARPISGPAIAAITAMLDGWVPPWFDEVIRPRGRTRPDRTP